MKKMTCLAALLAGAFLAVPVLTHGQPLATNINCYVFPCALPDVSTPEFGTARNSLMSGLTSSGHPLATRSRVGVPTALEIREVFEANDMCVSSNMFLWRGMISPPSPYAAMKGERIYAPAVIMGTDGMISLSRLEYKVSCAIALYDNQSSFAVQDYSLSRMGIQKGPDGILFTPDDIVIQSGPGTVLADAVMLIGARVGAEVENQTDLNNLSSAVAQLGTNGMSVSFEYRLVLSPGVFARRSHSIQVYPDGTIPTSFARPTRFSAPNGFLYSVVGPSNSVPMILETSRSVLGPWVVVDEAATEGTSGFIAFTRNPTNDQGYFKLRLNP